jgi:hypothetical protein
MDFRLHHPIMAAEFDALSSSLTFDTVSMQVKEHEATF